MGDNICRQHGKPLGLLTKGTAWPGEWPHHQLRGKGADDTDSVCPYTHRVLWHYYLLTSIHQPMMDAVHEMHGQPEEIVIWPKE